MITTMFTLSGPGSEKWFKEIPNATESSGDRLKQVFAPLVFSSWSGNANESQKRDNINSLWDEFDRVMVEQPITLDRFLAWNGVSFTCYMDDPCATVDNAKHYYIREKESSIFINRAIYVFKNDTTGDRLTVLVDSDRSSAVIRDVEHTKRYFECLLSFGTTIVAITALIIDNLNTIVVDKGTNAKGPHLLLATDLLTEIIDNPEEFTLLNLAEGADAYTNMKFAKSLWNYEYESESDKILKQVKPDGWIGYYLIYKM